MSEFRRRLLMQSNKDNPVLNDYLTIVALEDGLTAKLSVNACEYCVDGDGVWKTLPANTATEPINAGQTLSFRGNLTPAASVGIGTFTVNKYYNLKGNCMSLLFGDNGKETFSLTKKNYAFYKLFYLNNKLISSSDLNLSAETLSSSCYDKMFYGCTSLISAPELPATELENYCYYQMFQSCTSLTSAPPELPATILTSSCYNSMFRGCTSLTKAPDLPAFALVKYCYCNMFFECTQLNYIKMLATDITPAECILNWVHKVASSGIFVKNKDATWDKRGSSGIPKGWTVITE